MTRDSYNKFFNLALEIRSGMKDSHMMTMFVTKRLIDFYNEYRLTCHFLGFDDFKKWVLNKDLTQLFEMVFSESFENYKAYKERLNNLKPEERFVALRRFAIDGKPWWCVWDAKNDSFSTYTCHGRYKTKGECETAIKFSLQYFN